ncbi:MULTISPECIES: BA14K family protein [unclassified Bartonella]|uniref:BA14K family protein n=1 Tax=unclassified Bartonella TaxID=2645622 RepID=UPI0035CED745
MKKVIKLAVLSAMSTVTVLMPLDTTLADMAWDHSDYVTRKIDNTMRDINKRIDNTMRDIDKRIDDTMKNMNRRADFPSHNFSSHSSHKKRGFFSDDFQKFVDDFHKSFDDNKSRLKAKHSKTEQQQKQQQHHHHHHHHYHHVENKTYHYVERKKTKHRNIHIDNSGDALAMGVLGLATGTILGTVFKKPEQPQIVYQTAPQQMVVYQQIPQEQIIYEVQQTATYQPLQQSWESDWLQYCKKKYRSFNPKTGTFRDRNGVEHLCYAPIN